MVKMGNIWTYRMSNVCFYGQYMSLFWHFGAVSLRNINTDKILKNPQKSAEIFGSGNWTRTSDIRINSYELVGQKVPDFCGFAKVFMVCNENPYVKCMF